MSVSFRIFADLGLVYIRYEGAARLDETLAVFQEYTLHPDFRPGQKQLIDLSRITSVENDYTRLMSLQARKADALMQGEAPCLLVYLAPTDRTQQIARMVLKSWEGLDGIVTRLAEDWDGAMDILGFRRDALDARVSGDG